jgi:outer membrane protein assembly factor BamB
VANLLNIFRRPFSWIAASIVIGALWIACGGGGGTSPNGTTTGTTSGTTTGITPGPEAGTEGGASSDASPASDSATAPDSATSADSGTTLVGASVLEHHLHPTRDGAYVDATVTMTAAKTVRVDPGFTATVTGIIYGHPLYVDGWQGGTDAVFVATDHNHVTALNATSGAVLWDVTLGPQVALGSLPCGPPYPYYGVFSTPIIDLSARTLYLESFQTPDGGTTKKHYVYALSIDTGATKVGWPVDVAATVPGFDATVQQDRGALELLNGIVYVPYAGLNDDCGTYNGWVVGISTTNPATVAAFKTSAAKGGIWGAVASDGTSLFVATGNAQNGTATWGDQEALLRLTGGPKFSGATTDYFTPSNWLALDTGDQDLGSSAPILFDMLGAPFPHLAAAMGKAGIVHLLNRDNLGGVGMGANGMTGPGLQGLSSLKVVNGQIKGTAASYTTAKGRYLVVHTELGSSFSVCPTPAPNGTYYDLLALSVTAMSPPTLVPAWCAQTGGKGSPIATTTDGTSNALVWIVSTGGTGGPANAGTNSLLAFDGDTGVAVASAAPPAGATAVQHWTSPVEAKGRFIVGATGAVYAFTTQ